MTNANTSGLSRIQKSKLIHIYFFPVIFLSFTSVYMMVSGEDPKTFFPAHVVISQTLILIPLILSLFMLVAKKRHKEKQTNYEQTSLEWGVLCFLFTAVCNIYHYYKFALNVISMSNFVFAFGMSILISVLVASLFFVQKYQAFKKEKNMNNNGSTE